MPEDKKQDEQKGKPEKKPAMMLWIVLLLVAIISAGAGIGVGQIFGNTQITEKPLDDTAKEDLLNEITAKENRTGKNAPKSWYLEMESVIANLNEPGATRYVMVTLILELNPNVDQDKGSKFFKEKSYHIKNWLTIYFTSLTLEEVQGDRNLKRIQYAICEMLNEKLFPGEKPQIQNVLFKEFAIQ